MRAAVPAQCARPRPQRPHRACAGPRGPRGAFGTGWGARRPVSVVLPGLWRGGWAGISKNLALCLHVRGPKAPICLYYTSMIQASH